MSSAPREATIPLTRRQYFTKTLYQNAAAKNLFVYNKVIYEKDEALRQTEEVNGRISMALLLVLLAVFVLAADGVSRRGVQAVLLAGCCLGVVMNLGGYYGIEEADAVNEYRPAGYAWSTTVQDNPAVTLHLMDDQS